MSEEIETSPTNRAKTPALTRGLTRNTIFNLIGWIWPIGLSILSVPFIVKSLGNDAYGVFAIVSIVAGYLGLLNGPVAMGNVRFMAEAYAHEQWPELREAVAAGLVINVTLSALGGFIMFLFGEVLARKVFAIPLALVPSAITVFRLASFSFFLNGVIGTLQGIPAAMRRYDIRNQVGLIVGTLNTVAIVLALWWGWGLLGAVLAQVLSSVLGLVLFSLVAWMLLRKLPGSMRRSLVSSAFVRRLAGFSSLLFAGQITSQIGLQIDKTLVGIMLGTSAVAYYMVPTKITDKIPGMMSVFSTTLYPLSSEAVATGKMDELRHLYHELIRILLWASAFAAALLIVLSKDFLMLWMGPEFMVNSWLVLALLAAGVVWRSSGSVAYQVCNGMGRADVNLLASIGTMVFLTVPVLILAPRWGAQGVALGVFIGLFMTNLAYDLFTQRKLLGVRSWGESLMPYFRAILAEVGAVVAFSLLSVHLAGWMGLFVKAGLVSCLYMGFSLVTGAIAVRDIKFVVGKVSRLFLLVAGRRAHG
jgi:O-antigen/teichoic acid export membrane protein